MNGSRSPSPSRGGFNKLLAALTYTCSRLRSLWGFQIGGGCSGARPRLTRPVL
jgi:hypothetical protein